MKEALAIREEMLNCGEGNVETMIHAADSRYTMGSILFEWSELEEASNPVRRMVRVRGLLY